MSRRRAEARDVRPWQGDVAARNDLDEIRDWVVWGVGVPAEEDERPGEPTEDHVAQTMAALRDPAWGTLDRADTWVRLVHADEGDVDQWFEDDPSVSGYAPFLMEARNAEVDLEPMRGKLRGDAVTRRKPNRMDAGRPD